MTQYLNRNDNFFHILLLKPVVHLDKLQGTGLRQYTCCTVHY